MRRSTERVLLAVLVLVTGTYAIAEEIVLSTYYPSPRGVYDSLRSEELYVHGGSGDATGLAGVPDGNVSASDALMALRCALGAYQDPYDAVMAPGCAAVDMNGDGSVTPVEADLLLRLAVNLVDDNYVRQQARFVSNNVITPRMKPGQPYSVEIVPGADFIMQPLNGSTGPLTGSTCTAFSNPIDPNCRCPDGMVWVNLDGDEMIQAGGLGVGECGFPPFWVKGAGPGLPAGTITALGAMNVDDIVVRNPGTVAGSVFSSAPGGFFNVTTVKSAVAVVSGAPGSVASASCVAPKIRVGCSSQRTNALGTQVGLAFNISAELTGAEPVGALGCQARAFNTNHVVYAFCMGP